MIYSVSIREAFTINEEYCQNESMTMSSLIDQCDDLFNDTTLQRIFHDLIRGYLFPEFELWKIKFFNNPCMEWSFDAAASFFNKLIVKGFGANCRVTRTLKTTIGHDTHALGFTPCEFFLLPRGKEDHDKILYHVAIDISLTLKYSKIELNHLYFHINSDAATRKNAENMGAIIYKHIKTILNVPEDEYKYENEYGFVYDLRFFAITVLDHFSFHFVYFSYHLLLLLLLYIYI